MRKYLILATTALLFAACSNDVEVGKTVEKEAPVPIRLGTSMQVNSTRSISQTLQATELADGASVGVYIYQNGQTTTSSGYGYKNVSYTAQNPTTLPSGASAGDLQLVTSTDQPYFPEDKSKTIDIYAFSPRTNIYTSTAELSTLTAQDVFATKADQTTDANYLASDFVWGNASGVTYTQASSTTSRILVTMDHMLSKVNVNIAPGTGMTLDKLDKAKITLNGVVLEGTVNFTTGAVSTRTGSTASSVILSTAVDKTKTTSFSDGGTPATNYTACTSSAVIIPQSIAASNTFITINLWDATANSGAGAYTTAYNVKTTAATTFAAKTVYTYNIIVNTQGLSLTTTINDWTTGTTTNGTAE